MRQFKEFEAMVPEDFASLMVDYWQSDENLTRDEVIDSYYDGSFKELVRRIAGTKCRFKPCLGYRDENLNGILCFEVEDDNIVIPVGVLEVV